jgi:prepilin-type N-terminal cleavage/methylation domain-containing protein
MTTPKAVHESGFTIIEVIVAIVVLTVGLLGLVTTAALVTRMIGRGQRSAVASTFASQRMERLRSSACIAAQRVNGADTLYRGGQWVAYNNWTFVDEGNLSFRVRILTTSRTVKNRTRTDTLEVGVPCLI